MRLAQSDMAAISVFIGMTDHDIPSMKVRQMTPHLGNKYFCLLAAPTIHITNNFRKYHPPRKEEE